MEELPEKMMLKPDGIGLAMGKSFESLENELTEDVSEEDEAQIHQHTHTQAQQQIQHSNIKPQRTSFNDFVRKLFMILESGEYTDIVRWSDDGSNFIVLETNKFTTDILPKHFKHSNFASFVRQLNKYDFHKIKKKRMPGAETIDNTWEFNHPFFRRHDEAALDNIKRKTSSQKKILVDENAVVVKGLGETETDQDITAKMVLKNTVGKTKFNQLKRRAEEMEKQIQLLTTENYNVKLELQKLNSKYNVVVESLLSNESVNAQMTSNFQLLTEALAQQGFKLPQGLEFGKNINIEKENFASLASPPSASSHDQSIRSELPILKPDSTDAVSATAHVLRPGFHVLLVEDDSVCIQLCSKFLRKYGCSVDVVTDGLSAISTLEKKRFDLVLMDIVMPNLDGATATSIVRSFDNETPIIAMTGNIEDQDLVTYLQHGMNDILAKPFTKDDLHSMLIRYLKDRIPLLDQENGHHENAQTYIEEPMLKKQHI